MTAQAPGSALATSSWADLSAPLPPFVRSAGAEAEAFTREFFAARIALADESSIAPLFQTSPRHTPALSGRPMSRQDVWKMVKRRCEAAGLPDDICNHSFRATGITIHQQRGGDIQEAAKLAGHKNVRTTQLYNRAGREIARAEVERVHL